MNVGGGPVPGSGFCGHLLPRACLVRRDVCAWHFSAFISTVLIILYDGDVMVVMITMTVTYTLMWRRTESYCMMRAKVSR